MIDGTTNVSLFAENNEINFAPFKEKMVLYLSLLFHLNWKKYIPDFFTCLNFRDFHPWQQNTLFKDFWLLSIDIMFLCEENIKWHPHDSQLHHYYPWVESQVSFISCIMEDSCSNYFFLLLGLEHGFEHVFLNMLKGNPLPSPNTSSAKSPGRPWMTCHIYYT